MAKIKNDTWRAASEDHLKIGRWVVTGVVAAVAYLVAGYLAYGVAL